MDIEIKELSPLEHDFILVLKVMLTGPWLAKFATNPDIQSVVRRQIHLFSVSNDEVLKGISAEARAIVEEMAKGE